VNTLIRYNVCMRTIPREVSRKSNRLDPVETIRRRLSEANRGEIEYYILGALHDSTFSKSHLTYRFSQNCLGWLEILKEIFTHLGSKSWIYKEGKFRSVWVLETSRKTDVTKFPKAKLEKAGYIRGYFDTEGGMPKSQNHFLYFQFTQKNRDDLIFLREMLESFGIKCGKVHNPSQKVDKNYWRFFLSRKSHWKFMNLIGSWHPRKFRQIELRTKI
jgi:hypothetical protein